MRNIARIAGCSSAATLLAMRQLDSVIRLANHGGFTLMELVITLTIASILAVAAIPSFKSFVLDNRLTAQTNDLVADLAFARSEAIKRGRNVTVCVREAGANTCNVTAPVWHSNRLVWVDENNDGTIDTAEILRARGQLDGDNVLLTSNIPATLTFFRDGLTNVVPPATGLPNHFKLCDRRKNAYSRVAQVDRSGRVRTTREASFTTDTSQTNFVNCPDI